MNRNLLLLLTCFLLMANGASAQFNLEAEFRPRSEYNHGTKALANKDQDPTVFTTQRTRLVFGYTDSLVTSRISLQDVRLYGSQPQLVMNEDFAVSLHEAWVEARLCSKFYIKVGRQNLAYDNQRIFGPVGWLQQGRSHDVAVLKYHGKIKAHLGVAYHGSGSLTSNIYLGPDAYRSMQFLHLSKTLKDLDLGFLFLNNGVAVTREADSLGNILKQALYFSQTIGPFIRYSKGSLTLEANAYLQRGKDRNKKELKAWEALIDLSYYTDERTSVGLGYEVLSGTPYDEKQINRSFTPLYGTNHKYNGYMDYFYVNNYLNSFGLHDIYLRAGYRSNKMLISPAVHVFYSQAPISASASSYLGTELDLTLIYNASNTLAMEFGYSHMLAGASMELIKGGSKDATHYFAYIMLTYKPKLFKGIQ